MAVRPSAQALMMILISGVILNDRAAARPLPLPITVESELESADTAIPKRWISIEIPISAKLRGHLEARTDLLAVQVEAISSLITDASVPNSAKRIRAVQPALGDQRIAMLLIEARRRGIKVEVIFEPSRILNTEFSRHEKWVGDVKRMHVNPRSRLGENFVRKLLANGFVLGADLIPAPLYNRNVLLKVPALHEAALLLTTGIRSSLYLGSVDWEAREQIDTMQLVIDPELIQDYAVHFQDLAAAYRAGAETASLPEFRRVKHLYQDGTSAELAFTNGRYNPNDRIVTALHRPNLLEVQFLQYALTDLRLAATLMKAGTELSPRITGIFDDQYATAYGFGLPLLLGGIAISRPGGPSLSPVPMSVSGRVATYVFHKRAHSFENDDDSVNYDRDGRPSDHVHLNTNTTVLYGLQDAAIFEGSLAARSDVQNAEYQLQINTVGNSDHYAANAEIYQGLVKSYSKIVVDTRVVAIASEMALLLGLNKLDVKVDYAKAITNAFMRKNLVLLKAMVMGLSKVPTDTPPHFSRETQIQNVGRYLDLLDLYFNELPPNNILTADLAIANFNQFIGAAGVIANAKLSNSRKNLILNRIVWRAELDADPAKLEALRERARTIVGL